MRHCWPGSPRFGRVAFIPEMGALNVRVNFCLAFRLALRARSVNPGDRIRGAAQARWRSRPFRFFLPA
ncbi:hypothetical protein [Variovorax sp. Root318D1]|uniref:hypothetical protein n=1 Tax=Variovorax sp. Root318D1 TaxID=1736513 RepID=UPI000A83CD0F